MTIYRPEIDGLRAIAVLPVIFYHAGFSAFSGGFVGVDVFFVISGYLITSIIHGDLERGRFSFLRFWERRARRILPALFLVTGLSLPAAWLLLAPADMRDFAQSVGAIPVFAANILFWFESGYFDTTTELKPLLHTWSLAVEEQYYLIFPLLFLLLWRGGGGHMLWTGFVGLGLVSLAVSWWSAGNAASAGYFLLPARAWELLAGVVCALVWRRGTQAVSSFTSNALTLTGLGMIGWAITQFDQSTPFPGVAALVPVTGTVMVILWARETTLAGRLLGQRIPVAIGLVSYSAYLWHQPLFAFARYMAPAEIAATWFAALIALTFGLAWMSGRFIEGPFRDGARVPGRIAMPVLVLVALGFIGFGAGGHLTNGYGTARFTVDERARIASAKRDYLPSCTDPETLCLEVRTPQDVLLLGDSNAFHFARALKDVTEAKGGGLANLTLGGCLPLMGLHRLDMPLSDVRRCAEFNDAVADRISRDDLPDRVVLSAAWALYFYGPEYFNDLKGPRMEIASARLSESIAGSEIPRAARADIFESRLRAAVRSLAHEFADVTVVGPLPPLGGSLDARALIDGPQGVFLADFLSETAEVLSMFERLADIPGVTLVLPHQTLCPGETQECLTTRDGRHLYTNPTHLSTTGQAFVFQRDFWKLIN